MTTAQQFLDVMLAHDITEEYDRLEGLCARRIEGESATEILAHLNRARQHLWDARMLADVKAGLR